MPAAICKNYEEETYFHKNTYNNDINDKRITESLLEYLGLKFFVRRSDMKQNEKWSYLISVI